MSHSRLRPYKFRLHFPGLGAEPVVEVFVLAAIGLGLLLPGLVRLLPGSGALPGIAALTGFVLATGLAASALRRAYPHDRLGLCNLVTLFRLALVMALIAPVMSGAGASWAVLVVAVLALSLDGIDGWLARRQNLVSGFGARFDMEVDSALALLLAVSAAVTHEAPAIVILLGLPRYLFIAAARLWPWLGHALPDRFSRKAVCVLQIAVLIALQVPGLPDALAVGLAGVAALAVAWSFGVDVLWLRRQRG